MSSDNLKDGVPAEQPAEADELAQAAARVWERYGDSVNDFLRALHERKRSGHRLLGSFMELAQLDHPYGTNIGTFQVSMAGKHRTLYKHEDGTEPRRIAFLLPSGAVCCVKDGDEYVDVAYALANEVRPLLDEAERIAAREFVSSWTARVSSAVEAGDDLVYQGHFRGEIVVGRFVVSQNGAGKEVSLCVPFLGISDKDWLTDRLFPLSRADPAQERILFRFLRTATAVSPPALVAANAERPARTL
jgi:hypothetical protein